MRGRWCHSTAVLFALLLGVAAAQKDNLKHDAAKPATSSSQNQSQSQSSVDDAQQAKSDTAAALPNGQSADQSTTDQSTTNQSTTDQQPAQPAVDAGAAPSSSQQETTPSGEPFLPPEDEDVEISKPRIPLPVILDSDFPHLDRSIKREDIQDLPDDYVIGEEDMLTITIWKERDVSGAVVVRPDGKVTVPLIGEVKVVGMKPLELETLLEQKLKPFITVPKVTVAVNQINSRKVYLIGQVVREGTFPINSSMTVLQVLAAAGGLRDFAKRKKIYVLRKQGEEEIRFPFDYDAAIKGRSREENIRVEPGDTIVVP